MKTRRFCPHCGRPVIKSEIEGYTFQCFGCEEDFYKIEVYRKKDMETVKKIRRRTLLRQHNEGEINCPSIYKPYTKFNY